MANEKLLIVDDEEDMLESCVDALDGAGLSFETATRGSEGIAKMRAASDGGGEAYDLLLTDLKMPGVDGLEVLRAAKQISPETIVILFTGYPTVETAVSAIKEGAFDYLTKPFSPDQLRIAVNRALAQKRLVRENKKLRRQLEMSIGFEDIIGESKSLQRVLDLVRKSAPTEANVLIVGESGTGKELVARSIHAHSKRKDMPFVPVDCAALPENLLESELFGHEKGAFTGAHETTPGLLETAAGGTIFFDEIVELSIALQAKLLRFLQERQIRRLGGRKLIEADVRIISATNTQIEDAVAANTFREDLYYRLNVIRISMPPLREREGDVPRLALHFLRKFSDAHDRDVKNIDPQAMDVLTNCPWPGNVRQLQNAIERAVSLADQESISIEDLPHQIVLRTDEIGDVATDKPYEEAMKDVVRSFEKKYLTQLLTRFHGNVSHAAKHAKLHRTSLHKVMNRHGMSSDTFKST